MPFHEVSHVRSNEDGYICRGKTRKKKKEKKTMYTVFHIEKKSLPPDFKCTLPPLTLKS